MMRGIQNPTYMRGYVQNSCSFYLTDALSGYVLPDVAKPPTGGGGLQQ